MSLATSDHQPHVPTDSRAFSQALEAADIPHLMEVYDGDHFNRIPERVETKVLPFFSETLLGEAATAVEVVPWGAIKAMGSE
jgi:hypothetical protein